MVNCVQRRISFAFVFNFIFVFVIIFVFAFIFIMVSIAEMMSEGGWSVVSRGGLPLLLLHGQHLLSPTSKSAHNCHQPLLQCSQFLSPTSTMLTSVINCNQCSENQHREPKTDRKIYLKVKGHIIRNCNYHWPLI